MNTSGHGAAIAVAKQLAGTATWAADSPNYTFTLAAVRGTHPNGTATTSVPMPTTSQGSQGGQVDVATIGGSDVTAALVGTQDAITKQFGQILFASEGTYVYKITETDGGKVVNGVLYDDSVYYAQVKVEIDSAGTSNTQGSYPLKNAITYYADEACTQQLTTGEGDQAAPATAATFTNRGVTGGSVSYAKVWDDDSDNDHIRPAIVVYKLQQRFAGQNDTAWADYPNSQNPQTVQLSADNAVSTTETITQDEYNALDAAAQNGYVSNGNGSYTKTTVADANTWVGTIEGLPEDGMYGDTVTPYEYRVVETGYKASASDTSVKSLADLNYTAGDPVLARTTSFSA